MAQLKTTPNINANSNDNATSQFNLNTINNNSQSVLNNSNLCNVNQKSKHRQSENIELQQQHQQQQLLLPPAMNTRGKMGKKPGKLIILMNGSNAKNILNNSNNNKNEIKSKNISENKLSINIEQNLNNSLNKLDKNSIQTIELEKNIDYSINETNINNINNLKSIILNDNKIKMKTELVTGSINDILKRKTAENSAEYFNEFKLVGEEEWRGIKELINEKLSPFNTNRSTLFAINISNNSVQNNSNIIKSIELIEPKLMEKCQQVDSMPLIISTSSTMTTNVSTMQTSNISGCLITTTTSSSSNTSYETKMLTNQNLNNLKQLLETKKIYLANNENGALSLIGTATSLSEMKATIIDNSENIGQKIIDDNDEAKSTQLQDNSIIFDAFVSGRKRQNATLFFSSSHKLFYN